MTKCVFRPMKRGERIIKCWSVSAPRLLLPWKDAILAAGPNTKLAQEWMTDDEKGLPLDKVVRKVLEEGREILCSPLIWQTESLYRNVDELEREPTEVIVNLVQCEQGNLQATWEMLRNLSPCFVPSSPRDIFSICANGSHIHKELGSDPVGIVTAEERPFDGVWRTPCVWLGSRYQEVAFVPSRYPINGTCWCAFRARNFLG